MTDNRRAPLHLLYMLLIENLLNRQEFDEASCSLVKRSAFALRIAGVTERDEATSEPAPNPGITLGQRARSKAERPLETIVMRNIWGHFFSGFGSRSPSANFFENFLACSRITLGSALITRPLLVLTWAIYAIDA